jgi:ATP-binding cassette subfamily C (CFTR/MRP) protein 1
MQNIIDTDFQKCTVISVMHRLEHVTKYDKLALLDSGRLVAFDTPVKLLSNGRRMEDLYRLECNG